MPQKACATTCSYGRWWCAANRIRGEAARRTAIPATHIVISATHTHSGPEVRGDYRDFLVRTAADTSGTDSVVYRG